MTRFAVTFCALVVLAQLALTSAVVRESVLPTYLHWNARLAAAGTTAIGCESETFGQTIVARGVPVEVRRGCDAIEPTLLFVSAVLASPVLLRLKWLGLAVGATALAMLNVMRIMTMVIIGVHFRRAFDVMHIEVWQPVFVFCSVALWIAWARWARMLSRNSTTTPTLRSLTAAGRLI